MGRNVKTIRAGDLGKVLHHARATQASLTARAIKDAAKVAATSARANAPVYNPAKWENTIYALFEHHKTAPGTLKRSIHVKRMVNTDCTFVTGLYASARFASDIERGFKHHIVHRRIAGRRFMFKAVNVVFKYRVNRELERAVKKMFRVR